MNNTKIAWATHTWNPWRGCTRVSLGCAHCYAEALVTTRLKGKWGKGAPRQRASEHLLNDPFRWNKKPWVCSKCGKSWSIPGLHPDCDAEASDMHRARVFSLSLGDWLDPEVPVEWLAGMLDTIRQCDQLTWLLCTKRPEVWKERCARALNYISGHAVPSDEAFAFVTWLNGWLSGNRVPSNIWVLYSAENQERLVELTPHALAIPAIVHGVSAEPLLGPLNLVSKSEQRGAHYKTITSTDWLGRDKISWVIAGGESGPKARPCDAEWIRGIVHQCRSASVACFVKQLGSNPWQSECDGATRPRSFVQAKGGEPAEWPEDLRVREFPADPANQENL